MPYKDEIKRREAVEKRRQIGLKIIQEARNKPCKRCKNRYPIICMDFHHRNPKNKKFGINSRAAGTRKIELILKEIKKCDVYCSNCHRIIEEQIRILAQGGHGVCKTPVSDTHGSIP